MASSTIGCGKKISSKIMVAEPNPKCLTAYLKISQFFRPFFLNRFKITSVLGSGNPCQRTQHFPPTNVTSKAMGRSRTSAKALLLVRWLPSSPPILSGSPRALSSQRPLLSGFRGEQGTFSPSSLSSPDSTRTILPEGHRY